MIVVPDAGPLIYLGGAGQLELLRALYERVLVPQVVYDEVVVAGAGEVGAKEVAAARWIEVERVDADRAQAAPRVRARRGAVAVTVTSDLAAGVGDVVFAVAK